MNRKEFPIAVKRAAAERSQGECECHRMTADIAELFDGPCERPAAEYDHILACILGGEATLENCAHLCSFHHKIKSRTDVGYKSKRNRFAVNRDRPHRDQPKQKMQSRPKGSWPKRAFPKRIKGERA